VLRDFPRARSPIQQLMAGLSGDDEGRDGSVVGASLGRLATLAPLLRQLDVVTRAASETGGTRASMQPVELTR
jgi:hypothetical protein